ncbi:MAG: hypothetical protein LAT55_06550 [Opitutales bacterium]|nr:hypothetical protein [Opitutales bacterium]
MCPKHIFRSGGLLLWLSVLAFFLTSCAGEQEKESSNSSGPEGYIRGTLDKGVEARVTTALIQVRQAIDHYEIHEGSFPESLTSLVEAGLLTAIPALPHSHEFEYDSSTGRVEVKTP